MATAAWTPEFRRQTERRIVRKVIRAALDAGYRLNLSNGGDSYVFPEPTDSFTAVVSETMAVDSEHLYLYKDGKRVGWVFFVYGNEGWSVVSDYTMTLQEFMEPINAYCDNLGRTDRG